MRDEAELHRRLDAVAARPGVGQRELEDLLTEGYARALEGEAQSRRLERRLAELLLEMDRPGVATQARRVALQRRTVDQAVADLRDKLARIGGSLAPGRGHPSASA